MSAETLKDAVLQGAQDIVIEEGALNLGSFSEWAGATVPFRFLATDFDGTLWGSQADRQFQVAYAQRIKALQEQGVLWCVATGRRKRSFNRLFYPLKAQGLQPDFLIIENAYIYSPGRWMDHGHPLWNIHIRNIQRGELEMARRALGAAFARIRDDYPGSKILRSGRDRLDIRFATPDDAHLACAQLKALLRASRMLMVLQYGVEIRMRTVPFTKGLAISEIAENIGLSKDDVLAIGDGHNDISMLDSSVARYVGCPSNAVDEVVEHVHHRDGHIASKRSLEGVISVLDAFVNNTVNSSLPATLVPAFLREDKSNASTHRETSNEFNDSKSMLMIGSAMYAVLIVLAHFEVIPFSRFILLPVRFLQSMLSLITGGSV